jgi:hypothetical protein
MSTESEYVSTYAEQLAQELSEPIFVPSHGRMRYVRGAGDISRVRTAVLYDDEGNLVGSFPVMNYRIQNNFRDGTTIDLELREPQF